MGSGECLARRLRLPEAGCVDDLTAWRELAESLGATVVGGCQWALTNGAHRLTLTPSAQGVLHIEVDVAGISDDLVILPTRSRILLDAAAGVVTGDLGFDAEVFVACSERYWYLDADDRELLGRLVAAGVTVHDRRIRADARADDASLGMPLPELVADMLGLAEHLARPLADRIQTIADALESRGDSAPVLDMLARRYARDPEVTLVHRLNRMRTQTAPSPEGLALLETMMSDTELPFVHRAQAAARLLTRYPLEQVYPLLGSIRECLPVWEFDIDAAVRPQVHDATRPWESRRAGLQILADCGLALPTAEVAREFVERLTCDPRGLSLLLWLGTHPHGEVRREVIGRVLNNERAHLDPNIAAYEPWIENPDTAADLAHALMARPSRTAAEVRLLGVLATCGKGESRAVAAPALIEPGVWTSIKPTARAACWWRMIAGDRHELVVRTLSLAAKDPARAAATLAALLDVLPHVEDYHARWRARVIRALGDSGDPQWTPHIVAELAAADSDFQEAAFDALGRLGDGAAIEALTPYAKRVGNSAATTRGARRAIEAIRTRLGGTLALGDPRAHGQLALAPDPDDDGDGA